MRNYILLTILLMLLAFTGCNTSNENPGGHTPEEIENAKPKPVTHSAAPARPTGGSLDGAQLYAENCAACHFEGRNGPSLVGIMNRREFPSGAPANDVRLRETIKMGRAMMPAFSNTLSDEQIDAIVKYVHTL